jgi:fucose 4-O-acetylase-like acetyltransferase
MSENKRIEWIDVLRGIAIFLVVWGHISYIGSDEPMIHSVIYSFHMPLFFFISGLVIGMKSDQLSYDIIWFRRRTIKLVVPYLTCSILYILLNASLNHFIQTNTVVKYTDIVYLAYKPVAQFWFLWVLIIYELGTAFLTNIIKKIAGKYVFCFIFVISFVISVSGIVLKSGADSTYVKMVQMWIAYVSGMLIGHRQCIEAVNGHNRWLFACPVLAIILYWVKYSVKFGNALEVIITLGIWFTMISSMILLAYGMLHLRKMTALFSVLGINSIYIYAFHSYFLCMIRNILRMFQINNDVFLFCLSMLFAMSGSLAMSACIKKYHAINWLFQPSF